MKWHAFGRLESHGGIVTVIVGPFDGEPPETLDLPDAPFGTLTYLRSFDEPPDDDDGLVFGELLGLLHTRELERDLRSIRRLQKVVVFAVVTSFAVGTWCLWVALFTDVALWVRALNVVTALVNAVACGSNLSQYRRNRQCLDDLKPN